MSVHDTESLRVRRSVPVPSGHHVVAMRCADARGARHGAPELDAVLHRGDKADLARQQLTGLVRGLLEKCSGIRDDVPADELAAFCLRAMEAAADAPDGTAVDRLVSVTLTGLRSTRSRGTGRR